VLAEVPLAISDLLVHVEPKGFKSLTSASSALVPNKYIDYSVGCLRSSNLVLRYVVPSSSAASGKAAEVS
jgi:hypothetical protein